MSMLKAVVFYIPFYFLSHLIKPIGYSYLGLVYLPGLLNALHMLTLNAELNACSLYIMLASNPDEAREFIQHFFSAPIAVAIALYLAFGALFIAFIHKVKIPYNGELKYKKYAVLVFLVIYSAIACGNENYTNDIDKIVRAIYEYNSDRVRNQKILDEKYQVNYGEITSIINTEKPQTYVVIFGESVDRKHMSLYGYHRETTPYFDSIKNELMVFDNVRSSFASTLLALNGSLTFDNDMLKGDIVSFLNQAGFKTFWISNQFIIEKSNGLFEIEAKLTNGFFSFKNMSHQRGARSSSVDGCLLPYIQRALNDKSSKKVIFIHLLGSHIRYVQRYPAEFDKFTTNSMNKCAREVAQYDNSIRYTDYVLSNVLKMLKEKVDDVSFMIYYSDHGEDCYDCSGSIHTHRESATCPHMYEIPMILWLSQNYKCVRDMSIINLHKSYTTGNMIHSLLDLIGLRNEYINLEKSLFNEKDS